MGYGVRDPGRLRQHLGRHDRRTSTPGSRSPFQGYGWLPFEPTPGSQNPAMATLHELFAFVGRQLRERQQGSAQREERPGSHGRQPAGSQPCKGERGAAGNINNRAGQSRDTASSAPSRRSRCDRSWPGSPSPPPSLHGRHPLRPLVPSAVASSSNAAREPTRADPGDVRRVLGACCRYRVRPMDRVRRRSSTAGAVEAADVLVDGQLERLTGTVVRGRVRDRARRATTTRWTPPRMPTRSSTTCGARRHRCGARLFGIYRRD